MPGEDCAAADMGVTKHSNILRGFTITAKSLLYHALAHSPWADSRVHSNRTTPKDHMKQVNVYSTFDASHFNVRYSHHLTQTKLAKAQN